MSVFEGRVSWNTKLNMERSEERGKRDLFRIVFSPSRVPA